MHRKPVHSKTNSTAVRGNPSRLLLEVIILRIPSEDYSFAYAIMQHLLPTVFLYCHETSSWTGSGREPEIELHTSGRVFWLFVFMFVCQCLATIDVSRTTKARQAVLTWQSKYLAFHRCQHRNFRVSKTTRDIHRGTLQLHGTPTLIARTPHALIGCSPACHRSPMGVLHAASYHRQ